MIAALIFDALAKPRVPVASRAILLLTAGLSLALSSCSMIDADACSDVANMSAQQRDAHQCNGGFLSSLTQRDSVYRGDDSARLWTGRNAETNGFLNTGAINKPAQPVPGKPFVGYYGTMRVSYEPDAAQLGTDIGDLQKLKGPTFNPDETTKLKFDKQPLPFFVKQTLGGILGLNYIMPDDMPGTVSFTTEQPIPKPQVLQVVRDILGRNGYEMRLVDGVYHIGKHETLAAMDDTAQAGRAGEQVTRIVRIPKGSTTEIANFAKQLVDADVSITTANGGDAVLIRGPASSIDQAASLVRSISEGNFSEDRLAVIPIKRASPEKLAEELSKFYSERPSANKLEAVTIAPLGSQRALLVAARDPRMMDGIRQLVDQLDRAAGEESSLRVVQLVHAKSDEAVERLKAVFGLGGNQGTQGDAAAKASPKPSNGTTPQVGSRPNVPQISRNTDESEDSTTNFAAPSLNITPGSDPRQDRRNAEQAKANANRPAGVALDISPDANVRIASDPTNNAVMIYSDYPTFSKLQAFLKTIDIPQAQVVIEATIAEVSLTDDLQYGVSAYLSAHGISIGSGSNSPTVTTPTSGGYVGGSTTLGKVTFAGVVQALQSVTTVKVISSPYLTVLNGKTARLTVGDQIPFATRTVDSTSSGTSTVSTQVDVKDTGIVLEVTPHIQPNNTVSMSIDQQVSKAADSAQNGNLTPVISNREVKSEVIVDSGNTILIGGLLQDRLDKTESGVPVLRKLPVIGDAFSQKTNISTRVELIILITPRVVRANSEIDEITRVLRAQTRAH